MDAAPITYIPNFIPNPDEAFKALQQDLEWEQRDAPRMEYYTNDFAEPYNYGRGRGLRTYHPKPTHPVIQEIRKALEEKTGSVFEVCFLNRYLNQSDQLGWHADNSPEMDDARPIGIVSLGVEREIWFRPNSPWAPDVILSTMDRQQVKLGHGSLCLMAPGMQDTWQHRIPKASFTCGERISLTFRGYLKA